MATVLLADTTDNDLWKSELIKNLAGCEINDVYKNELTLRTIVDSYKQRKECDYILYILTPSTEKLHIFVNILEDIEINTNKTIVCVLPSNISNEFIIKKKKCSISNYSTETKNLLKNIENRVIEHGSKLFKSLDSLVCFLEQSPQITFRRMY